MTFSTPILLITWRRPELTKRVIKVIRSVAPQRMYVASDGPSHGRSGEAEKVADTRAVITQSIDWPCMLKQQQSETNQGCRLAVSRAIDWFFAHEQEGIILEDDCLPHPDFFSYCSALLEHYRHDTRIWSICGSNFQQGHRRGDASYYFSIHGDSWGWASWRRAWIHYHPAEHSWIKFRDSSRLDDVFPIPQERNYWRSILDELFLNRQPDSWDYQWWLAGWMNHALHAWPNQCLVSNLGFGDDGTHTFGANAFAEIPLCELGTLRHPEFIVPSRDADRYAFLHRRGGLEQIHRANEGSLHAWRCRWRAMKRQGLLPYLAAKTSLL
ncbi:glycosyltransferase family 2 protein [Synechococcus sp. Cruz-9H2]|uniref:glycosyltransferase family 2 protein n=1 Tax=unclassified Synechococcus TaxID=2626047 RepID=UPI0020CCD6AE|nr:MULTISPECIES: glycosyltransferase family 2 protein [unclassified Synechococcus]MCP9820731.1 glycosyltransferase family 2 protein [Synechococcus sp. Cruz-9H2]MCP9845013.1 glycosyltransferase family 2 protein [Synechococcus sp. Edmonson 11F2]MCP9857134.1 glycosyltransferase family 2 protein [Synechococcus sp. Cruz-9C9]MCP9864419.1 glycosyltransferase family 2 protein [Synechococcus sp. Cruz-7E5]MCP9871641.1 glycosyltransferase family 2 protein [Synechococcus sp. Cruz-7B9]